MNNNVTMDFIQDWWNLLTLSVFWPLKMSIFSKRTNASREVRILLLFKHIFNIQNKNYLNFSKFYSINNDFDPKMKRKNRIEMVECKNINE